MMENKGLDNSLDKRGGIQELLFIALPMVVSQGCDTVMIFTDRLFLSKLGALEMNAAFSGGLACFTMMTFFLGLIGYTTALVAQNLGAKRPERCGVATTQAVLIVLAAYPLILLIRPLVHWGFQQVGVQAEQLELQTTYFNIVIYGTLLGLFRQCFSSFFSGIGRTRVVMVASITAMIVNVGANYILIFGKCGVPALGIRGAAIGTILGGFCGLLIMVAIYLSPVNRKTYQIGRSIRFDWDTMRSLCRFGYPAGIEMFLNVLAFNGLVQALHGHNSVTGTAATIMFNWNLVSFVPLIGVQIGVMSLVGRYMGAREPDIAQRATYSGLKAGWVYSAIILVLFVFFPQQLVNVFASGEDALYQAATPLSLFMLRMASLYVMVEAAIMVFGGALRGAGDTLWAMTISVSMHWLLLAVIWISLYGFNWTPRASWSAVVITFLACSGLFYLRFRAGKWRNIQVVPSTAETLCREHEHDFVKPREL